jgi:uncharacterized protein YdhG (YjbR/CyaY superfamily)
MSSKKPAKKPAGKPGGFTAEERAAMKDRVREMKSDETEGEAPVLAKIAQMREPDRAMAKRVHAIVMASAPALAPRLWYGMPAYAKDGKVICHFQNAQKFKMRYSMLGFSDKARLDDGDMWPVVFALNALTPAVEARIGALVKQAVGW